MSSPVLCSDGRFSIDQSVTKKTWQLLFDILEDKMSQGELIIIDATHLKVRDLERYIPLCNTHRYRPYIVDFTGVEFETLLQRNSNRPTIHQLPEKVLHGMRSLLDFEDISRLGFEIIQSDECDDYFNVPVPNLNHFKKITHYGDSFFEDNSYTTISQFILEEAKPMQGAHVIMGDTLWKQIIDNPEDIGRLKNITSRLSVFLIESPYSRLLWKWVTGQRICSDNFNSIPYRLQENITFKKQLREILSLCRSYLEYTYSDNRYVISHTYIPYPTTDSYAYVKANTFIYGISSKQDFSDYKNTDIHLICCNKETPNQNAFHTVNLAKQLSFVLE